MIAKILKKLGLGHAAYTIVKPFYTAKYKGVKLAAPEKAMKLLWETSPDRGESCCIPPRPEIVNTGADLDIIVPAYNVVQYIRRCIDSVQTQKTKYRFRILAIDDGSTDDTGAVLDSIPGLTVIHQENMGLSGARNTGLAHADAKYVMFLDSDDCLCPGAVEALLNAAEEHEAWITEGGYTEVYTNGKVIRRHKHKAGELDPLRDCEGYAWGKLIRRELFQQLDFPISYWYQDSIMRQLLLPLAKNNRKLVWGVQDSVVLYSQNPGGITKKSRGRGKSLDSLYVTLRLFDDRKQLGLPLTMEYYDYLLSMAVQTYSRTHLQSREVQQAIFTVYADFLQRNFPDWHTEDRRLACLEKALRSGDYGSYLAYCRLH